MDVGCRDEPPCAGPCRTKAANTLYFPIAWTVGEPRLRITQSEVHQLYNSLLLLLLREYLEFVPGIIKILQLCGVAVVAVDL